ncbi:hypothetical protein AB0I82_04590 [Streptomyces sp. NPDC050315]|uniref:hypothetical protein n=1 Tax=Streptomyces sp. NPDC050315 TaxID=3155039 RepID=UPI00342789CD
MKRPGIYRNGSTVGGVACGFAAALIISACGGNGQNGEGREGVGPAIGAKEETEAPKESAAVPTLAAGKTASITTSDDEFTDVSGGSADVTLVSVKTAKSVPDPYGDTPAAADPGERFVCLEFKVKNTGQEEFDTFPLTTADWTGKDGETKGLEILLGVDCKNLGQQGDDLTNVPNPGPGEFVRGTTPLSVPSTQPGVVEFSDRSGVPLFQVKTQPAR